MNAKELKDILQVLKDFEIDAVKLKMGELEIECQFARPATTSPAVRKPANNFPDARYAHAIMHQDITAEELAVLGMSGVAPTAKAPVEDPFKERVKRNLSKKPVVLPDTSNLSDKSS